MNNSPVQRDLLRAIELAAIVYENPGNYTENELASILRVSVQTLRRDAEKLRFMNIPIHSTKRYYHIENIKLKELNELICLYLSLNKFDTIKNLKTIRKRFGNKVLNVFVKILKAVDESMVIRIIYGKNEKDQDIVKYLTPMALNRQGRNLYLVALENDNPDRIRIYSIEKITSIEFTKDGSKVKKMPDLYSYFSHSWGMYASGKKYDVILKFQKETGDELKDKIYMEDQDFTDYGDYFLLKMKLNISYEFASWVMGWGGEVEIIRPTELKELIISRAKEIIKLYGKNKR